MTYQIRKTRRRKITKRRQEVSSKFTDHVDYVE